MKPEQYHDSDIEKERYEQATEHQQYIFERCWDMWDPRTVIPMEIGDWYSSELQEDKDIHTVLDVSGAMDYLVDPFTSPPFGLNHRNHNPTDATLRFDIRAKNGTNAGSELDKLRQSVHKSNTITPKYATRMKLAETGVDWFRIVHLQPLVEAIELGGLDPIKKFDGDDYTAWFFEYDLLEQMGVWVAEFDGDGTELFADKNHKD